MLVSFFVPCAFADDAHSSNWTESDMFFAALNKIGDDLDFGTGMLGLATRGVASMGSQLLGEGSVCKMSDDGLHHSSKYNQLNGGGSDLVGGKYLNYQCDQCGQMFKAYSNDLKTAYDNNVKETYPLNGYGSDGGFYWCPTISDCLSGSWFDALAACSSSGVSMCNYKYLGSDFGIRPPFLSGDYPVKSSGRYSSMTGTAHVTFYDRYVTFSVSSDSQLYGLGYSLRCALNKPISGTYTLVSSLPLCNSSITRPRYELNSSGSSLFYQNYLVDNGNGDLVNGATFGIAYLPTFKVTPSQSISNTYFVQSTRVGSVNFNLATKQGDVVNNYYPNVQIFNETTNVYTNPSTGQQQNVSSWTYDYSSRTYHLTLEDGSLLDIEFADDSINVKVNGEITQKYYYTVEKEEEAGPTPTPDPGPVDPTVTPTPDPGTTPTPSPEPGPEPEDPDDPDNFFEWLKQWLIEFKEWLGDWLDKLFNKEPGDITIDESDNSVHINDQDDLDYDIYYTDDTGEQRQTSLRDLLHKFDFLRDIYDIGRDLFSIVGADAAAAHAYNSTGTVDITPYLGNLRTVAAADVMPIAGGSGAPSLKMNLGAANSHYGYTYGGEVEILDLSWYTPYKGTVDNLLSGFLWLFFAWRLFKHAPSIVSGAGMVSEKAEDIRDGKRH